MKQRAAPLLGRLGGHLEGSRSWEEQVTRGHNIVADGWVEASTPILTPTHPPHSNIRKKYLKRLFPTFKHNDLRWTNGSTDQQTNAWAEPLIELRVSNERGKKTSHPRIALGQRYPMPCLERLAEEVE